ncbi:hypothetical protein D9M73_142700 [compost metagenome]
MLLLGGLLLSFSLGLGCSDFLLLLRLGGLGLLGLSSLFGPLLLRRLGRRQLRHQHHAYGHAQHGGRELHQAVCVTEPADTAGSQVRGNLRVDQQRNLRNAHTQQGRHHQFCDIFGRGIGPCFLDQGPAQADFREHAQAQQRRHLHRQLQDAAQHHAAAQGVNRLNAVRLEPRRAQPGRRNHGQVEQHRRGRRHRKTPPGVEYTRRQCHQRHEADIRKHPARHEHRCLKTARLLLQPAGHDPDQHRCGGHTRHAGQQQRPGEQGGNPVYQQFCLLLAVFGLAGSQHRYKGLAESPLGKQAAKQVGYAKCHVEGVGHGAGAKSRCDQQLTHQACDAGNQGEQ